MMLIDQRNCSGKNFQNVPLHLPRIEFMHMKPAPTLTLRSREVALLLSEHHHVLQIGFDTLKLNWVTKICIFRISGINLSHLGADLSILGAKKRFMGVKYP
jgi:hypothetical protein